MQSEGRQMFFVSPSQYGRNMSHAQSAAPANPAPANPAPANPLMDTVLPVRAARIDRDSAERLKPGMVDALLDSGEALAIVLSQRRALVSGNRLWHADAT